MNNKLINQEEFSLMLENYRLNLKKLNSLTETEIVRMKSLENSQLDKRNAPPKAAAKFINTQLFSCLDNLAALAATIPEYTVHGCFTKEERNQLQQQALEKLKKLGFASPMEI